MTTTIGNGTNTERFDYVDPDDADALVDALEFSGPEYLLGECSDADLSSQAADRGFRLVRIGSQTLARERLLDEVLEGFHRDHHGPGRADMCDEAPCRMINERIDRRDWYPGLLAKGL